VTRRAPHVARFEHQKNNDFLTAVRHKK
jgi:hypothetical protein